MKPQLAAIREAFDNLRPHIRPEADHLAGAMSVVLDQADSAANEYDFEEDEATAAPKKRTGTGKAK